MEDARYKQSRQVLNGIVAGLYRRATERARGVEPPPAARLIPGDDVGITVIDDPEQVDTVLRYPDRFIKYYAQVAALGNSRFNTNSEEWRRRRDLTQKHYVDAARRDARTSVTRVYERTVASMAPDATLLERTFLEASLTVFHAALGCDFDLDRTAGLFNNLRRCLSSLQFLSWMPAGPGELEAARSEARALLANLDHMMDANDSLSTLKARFSEEATDIPAFSPAEEFLMNLFAGIETSTSTLLWCTEQLGRHPDLQEAIHAEVASDCTDRPVTERFIRETMRRFPSIPFVVREVAEPTRVGTVSLQPHQVIIVSIVGVHHHPGYWRKPLAFDPDRPEFAGETRDRRAFIPFSAGPRICGGAGIARMELLEGMSAMVRHFRVHSTGREPEVDYALAMRPDPAASLRLERR